MKNVEKEHKGILVQLKESKCIEERLKGVLVASYSKIKFLKLEIIQANVKVERISTKKFNNVLFSQNLHMIRPVCVILEKEVRAANPRRK